MSPIDFQVLLQRYAGGDQHALQSLIWYRVCPSCGRSPLNVSWPAAGTHGEVMAACLLCGWTSSHGIRLRQIPQAMLAQRQLLFRQFQEIKDLIRVSILDGAAVEPGPYRVSARPQTRVVCNQQTLSAVLTNDEFERIKQLLPRYTAQYVTVKFSRTRAVPSYWPLHQFAPLCEMSVADDSAPSRLDLVCQDGSHDTDF